MKRLSIALIFSTAFLLFLSHLACDKHPVDVPAPPPTPTPTFTPVPVQIGVYAGYFSPNPVTILAGQVAVWTNQDGGLHGIQTDDGTGICQTVHFIDNLGDSVTIGFSNPTTINYHDWFNCNSGSGTCNFGPTAGSPGCDGSCAAPGNMTGVIFVQ